MITTEFDKFSFHDSSVEKVDRRSEIISIEFENAFMSKDHPEANATDWLIDSGVLHLCNVTSEVPLFWYDNIEGKPHPEPQLPIDSTPIDSFSSDPNDPNRFKNLNALTII